MVKVYIWHDEWGEGAIIEKWDDASEWSRENQKFVEFPDDVVARYEAAQKAFSDACEEIYEIYDAAKDAQKTMAENNG